MKGIQTGDLGPKFGYNSKDNGWAVFDNVRIPRTNMLMGISELDKEGNLKLKADPRILYATMMLIRTNIITDIVPWLFAALQISLRYAVVRR